MIINETLGLLLAILGGFTTGTFAIFLKYMSPLKWENFWGLYVFVSLILAPVIFASFVIPDFFRILSIIPFNLMLVPMIFGAIWGIGNILFGLSLVRIGLALTYTIVLGLVILIGTVLPIFINNTQVSQHSVVFLVLGLPITLLGVILSGYAGIVRDGLEKLDASLKLGILIAILSGITSSMLNIGFVSAREITKIIQAEGISATNASSLIWVIVLFSGFLVNIGYVIYLLIRKKTMILYRKITLKIILAVFIAGVFWYSGTALFGFAANMLGSLGPSVGWAIFISLSVVVSNMWSIKFGEWKKSSKALNIQIKSLVLIVLGVISIAISALK